jgi:ATP-dependent RNA helicase DDX3X
VTGDDVPKHVDDFESLELHKGLMSNIKLAGYKRPTPVQKYGVPIVKVGRDLMACAQTGSGKTAAFLFPLIHHMLTTPPKEAPADYGGGRGYSRRMAYPQALIVAPTRELASQILEEARKFCWKTGLRPVVVYGGAPIGNQLRELERACDILVATPGRLVDILERGRCSMSKISVCMCVVGVTFCCVCCVCVHRVLLCVVLCVYIVESVLYMYIYIYIYICMCA